MRRILVIVAILMVSFPVVAQESTPEPTPQTAEIPPQLADVISAEFRTNSLTPLIGEPIEITLTVQTPQNVVVVDWPEFDTQWGDFMVIAAPERIAEVQDNGDTTYIQSVDLRLWKTGDARTPETFIQYQTLEDDETYSVPVRPLFFTIPSVLETTDLNQLHLKPSSPLINMFYISPWMVLAFLIAFGGVGVGGRVWWKRWRDNRPIVEETPLSPLEKVLNYLDTLSTNLVDSSAADVYAAVVNELRTYLSATYDQITLDMTHEDIISTLMGDSQRTEKELDDLRRILEQGTLVKYAAATPSEQNSGRFIEFTRQWLIETQEQVVSE